MKQNTVVVLLVAGGLVLTCGFGGMLSALQAVPAQDGDAAAREAQQGPVDREEQPVPQAGDPDSTEAPSGVPAWADPEQVAGAEAGAAAGLTYARLFALRQAIHEAGLRGAKDAPGEVARAEGLSEDVVWDAMMTVGAVQKDLRTHLEGGVLGAGVIGKVRVTGVGDAPLGPLTVQVVVRVVGCPGRTDLRFLAETAARRVAANLPPGASGYRGFIEYEGLRCTPGRWGAVTYDAGSRTLTLG
ncbi:MAG: hypothetical protein JXX28_08350 [Deltaproteobacteria bacterium]|nr:hypothetical protein [Deltaproteobacteria bacterium]